MICKIVGFSQLQGYTEKTQMDYFYGAKCLLDWLETQCGRTWQERWLNGEPSIMNWGEAPSVRNRKHFDSMRLALSPLLCLRVLRPSYEWLNHQHFNKLHLKLSATTDTEDFRMIKETAKLMKFSGHSTLRTMLCATLIAIHTGKRISAFTLEDLQEYDEKRKLGIHYLVTAASLWNVLRYNRIIEGGLATSGTSKIVGALESEELLDKYLILDPDQRFVFASYLDHCSVQCSPLALKQEAAFLLEAFWRDILHHHPEQLTFEVSRSIANAWKKRKKVDPDTGERMNAAGVFSTVRAFYAFLDERAREDPETWEKFAAYNPVDLADIQGEEKLTSDGNAKKRKDTAEKLQYLGIFWETLRKNSENAMRLLEAARQAGPGEQFEANGKQFLRVPTSRSLISTENYGTVSVKVTEVGHPGAKNIDAVSQEHSAFWIWASMDLLLRTGLRPWELYRLEKADISKIVDTNNNVVPCLMIRAGKTDEPRVVQLTPKAVATLSHIMRRVQGELDSYPAVPRFEVVEGEYVEDAQLILQKSLSSYRSGFYGTELLRWLHTFHADLYEQRMLPDWVTFTPKDCRRLVATKMYIKGVPLLEIQRFLGHKHLQTTSLYIGEPIDTLLQQLKGVWDD
ncbi:integrase [Deinococcus metalli]|nr:site-specific integrase [Deinococcus metalli]MBB5378563.1 integrase [Deinococcus metalli]